MCLQRFNVPSGNESYRRISNCTVNEAEIEPYYRNLKSDEPFIPGRNSLDYSLQLTLGIVKWHEWYKRSFPTEYATVFPSATPAPGVLSSAASTSSLKLKKQKAVSIPMVPASEAFDRGD